MSAVKSSNNIYVYGTGNTLSSITSDIADTTFIEDLGSNIYEMKGNVTRNLSIQNGGELIVSDGETLQFNPLANQRTYMNIAAGGKFYMSGSSVFDLSVSSYYSNSIYVYGALEVLGDGTNNPTIKNPYRFLIYESQQNNTYTDDIIHIENATIGSTFNSYNNFFQFSSVGKGRPHIFKNILCDNSVGRGNLSRAFYFSYSVRGSESMTFENIDFTNYPYPFYNYGMAARFKNCTFSSTTNWKAVYYNSPYVDNSKMPYYFDMFSGNPLQMQQLGSFLDNPTFENVASTNGLLVTNCASVLLSGGTFKHTSGIIAESQYGAVLRICGTQTVSDTTPAWIIGSAGHILWVKLLDLTVNDTQGNPVSGATIIATQSESKEQYIMETDETGKIKNQYDLPFAFLTNICQYEDSVSTNIEYWSDTSNSTYHTISAVKNGYNIASEDIVMDADKSMTLVLTRKGASSLAF